MAQWTLIEDQTGMTYVITSPHFLWEDGYASFRTDDVDVSAVVLSGDLLKVVVADNDSVEAVGFVAGQEKNALAESADLEYLNLLPDIVGVVDLLGGEGDFAAAGGWTANGNWVIAGGVATRTAEAANYGLVHDVNAVAGTLYKITYTITRTDGGVTPTIGAATGTQVVADVVGGVQYIVAGDTTPMTFTADGTFAGTVDDVTVEAVDLTAYTIASDTALTAIAATGVLTWTYTAGTDDTCVAITLDDLLNEDLVLNKLYKLTLSATMVSGDTTTIGLYNVSDELVAALTVTHTDLTDIEFYFHYEADMYLEGIGAGDGDTLTIDPNGWEIKEVSHLGTDALKIMNSEGEAKWDFGTAFDKNSDDYTFIIYQMYGGSGFTRLETRRETHPDIMGTRDSSRGTTMEYPDHKDMEDFD